MTYNYDSKELEIGWGGIVARVASNDEVRFFVIGYRGGSV
jgi:hypothetical protein